MATFLYDNFLLKLAQAKFDFSADSFKMMLVTSTYVPNRGTHDFRNDVTNEVAAGGGYTAGGAAITATLALNTGTHVLAFGLSDVVWSVATFTARAGVIYKARGGLSSADELVAYIDFGADKSPAGVDFTVHVNTDLTLG
jgi:hypothetical protein